jgi:hypothetical protein
VAEDFSKLTDEELRNLVVQLEGSLVSDVETPSPDASPTDVLRGTGTGRFMKGVADLLLGPAQLGANIGDVIAEKMGYEPVVGDYLNNALRQYKESQERGRYTGGLDIAGIGGGIAGGLGATKGIQAAQTLMGRVGQGMGIGGGFGAAAPVTEEGDYGSQKATQVGGGVVAGGAIPFVAGAAKLARNVIDPILPGGATRVAERTLKEAAGPQRPEIIALLEQNKQLPGGKAGMGEVAAPAGRAEFSAMQLLGRKGIPSEIVAAERAERGARSEVLRKVGGGRRELKAAEKARSKAAGPLYKEAFDEAVKADPALSNMAKNDFFKTAIRDASRIAQAEGRKPKDSFIEYLHDVKLSLDKQLKAKGGETALGKREKDVVEGIQRKLVKWMGEKTPSYEKARAAFEKASKPINQMQVVQALGRKLKIGDKPFLRSVDEPQALLKSELKKYAPETLRQAVSKPQMKGIKEVESSLLRKGEYDELSKAGRDKAAAILGSQTPTLPAMGMFNPKYSVLRSISNRLAGRVEGQSLDILEQVVQNPARAAELLKKVRIEDQPIISQAILQIERAAAIGAGQNVQ